MQVLEYQHKLPPPRLIAIDVDATLMGNMGQVNRLLLEYLARKKAEGFRLLLWSMRGREQAQAAIKHAGAETLFHAVESKPGYIIDDQGWSWVKGTVILRDFR